MKVFWFDCETTGVDSVENGIIQLAYIVEIDGKEVQSGELFSNCSGKKIEQRALEVNGFLEEDIKSFPSPFDMYRKLIDIFDTYISKFDRGDKFIAGGYNVDFDMIFIRQLWKESRDNYFGSWFGFGHIDPSQIIRFLQYSGKPFKAQAKLVDIANSYGISIENAHDALADVRMTIEVVKAIQKEIGDIK